MRRAVPGRLRLNREQQEHMARHHSFVLFATAGLWAFAASLTAQHAVERERDHATDARIGTAASLRQGCGLQIVEGDRLLGVGPDYNAWFGREGISFSPALGKQAAHDLPLAFTTTVVGRGGELLPVAAASRAHAEKTVSYRRGSLVETYEVRPEGVKQSFVFHTLPQGGGDLVVRGAVTTDLQPGAAAGDAMTWSLPGVGGVSIAGVLGIDGAGRQVRGSLAVCDGGVEFRLPATFVDSAVLPLVLDPLIGASVNLGGAFDDRSPDLAWDATSGRWLAVWQRIFSGTNADIRGQFFDTNGALIGSFFAIESNTATYAYEAAVANINGANAFVVAYGYGGDVFARGVIAATGALTAEIGVATGSDNQGNVALGSEAMDFAGGEALAVWRNLTTSSIQCRPIAHNGVALVLGTTLTVDAGSLTNAPAVSRSGGEPGRLLITWPRITPGDIYGRVWQRGNTLLTPATLLVDETRPCSAPATDGDGTNWVLAYSRREATGTRNDVLAMPVRYASFGAITGTAEIIADDPLDDESGSSVGWLGNSALVAWMDEVGTGSYDTYVRSVDPFGCTNCEGTYSLGVTAADERDARVYTKFSSGGFGSRDAALVWGALVSGVGDVLFQQWRAQHGAYTSLGGGCGSGGQALASCATNPNSSFRVRLRSGRGSTTVWGIISFDRNDYVCSPCTLIADPFSGAVWSQASNSFGDVSLNLPIPTGSGGVQFYLQYVSLQPSCALGIETSSAIRVGIEN